MSVDFESHDHVAQITLNRPQARNAVNGEVATQLEAALDRYESDDSLWVAVLTGRGSVFCAGADLKEIAAGNGRSLSTERGGFGGLVKRARTKPLLAAVNGPALAGGLELMLACDLAIAAQSATFGLPEVKRSLIAAAGGLFRLPRLVGKSLAMEMVLSGDAIDSSRALTLGLVNAVVRDDDLASEAARLAARITVNAPLAVQASRALVEQAVAGDEAALWSSSRERLRHIMSTEDFQEGPRAFVEKRAPAWKAR